MQEVHTDVKPASPAAQSSVLAACVNCGELHSGRYCPVCGQRRPKGRHTVRSLARGVAERLFNAEAGLIHTVVRLTIRPGPMIREYFAGRTIPYVHPAAYLLVAAGTFAFSSSVLGGPTGAADADRFVALLLIPFVAGASRILFWHGRYNFAEHLIGSMYLSGHCLLVLAVLYVAVPFVSEPMRVAYVLIALALAAAYFLWGYSQLFPGRRILAGLAGVAALVLGALAWFVVMVWLVNWLRGSQGDIGPAY